MDVRPRSVALAAHKKLGEILGAKHRTRSTGRWGDVAPQLATYVLETIYGEIYQSEVLDARTRPDRHRGGAGNPRQPRRHNYAPILAAPCDAASPREELVEIMMQLVPYVGVAAAIKRRGGPAGEVFSGGPTRSRPGSIGRLAAGASSADAVPPSRPSTGNSTPVMKLASSEARNRAAWGRVPGGSHLAAQRVHGRWRAFAHR